MKHSVVVKRETVLLIHGLWANALSLIFLARYLKKMNYKVEYFKYPSMRHSLDENARELRNFINTLDTDCCHLVGHSLGGMIALSLLQNYAVQNVGRVLLMGSPVNGSKVARTIADARLFSGVLGKCTKELCHGLKYNGSHPVAIIAGSGGWGFGHLITHIDPPHDGAVMVAEASLDNATEQLVLPTSHFSMLFSRLVSQNIGEYLRSGRFVGTS